jgi:hypothetical protein
VIAAQSDLLLQTPESLHARFRLDVRVQSEVIGIDRAAKALTVRDLATGETYDLEYDYLVLSPGAQPVVPPLPGIELALTLRTVEDVTRIADAVARKPKHAVVIVGGFIGVETAENLIHKGIPTTLVEAMDQVLAPLDPEMALPVADELRRHGVDLRLEPGAERPGSRQVAVAELQPLVTRALGQRLRGVGDVEPSWRWWLRARSLCAGPHGGWPTQPLVMCVTPFLLVELMASPGTEYGPKATLFGKMSLVLATNTLLFLHQNYVAFAGKLQTPSLSADVHYPEIYTTRIPKKHSYL